MKRLTGIVTTLCVALCLSAANADVNVTSTNLAAIFDDSTPFSDTIVVGTGEVISDLTISMTVDHTHVSDLTATLTNGSTTINLIDNVSFNSENLGVDPSTTSTNNLVPALYTFSDGGSIHVDGAADALSGNHFELTPSPGVIYLASNSESFAALFGGQSTAGSWTLNIMDNAAGDSGNIIANGWSISFTSAVIPEPSSFLLLSLAACGGIVWRRKRA